MGSEGPSGQLAGQVGGGSRLVAEGGMEGARVSPQAPWPQAPSSVLRVHLTRATSHPDPSPRWGTMGPRERRGAAKPEQFQAVPGAETIVPIIQS